VIDAAGVSNMQVALSIPDWVVLGGRQESTRTAIELEAACLSLLADSLGNPEQRLAPAAEDVLRDAVFILRAHVALKARVAELAGLLASKGGVHGA
jgi:hypothetical protein